MQYDMEDLLEQANEVQESLSRSYAVPDEIDEADLEAGMFVPLPARSCSNSMGSNAELDALGLEDEEEGTSYLADLNQAPDFVDEAPVELTEVRISNSLLVLPVLTLYVTHSLLRSPQKPSRPLSALPPILI